MLSLILACAMTPRSRASDLKPSLDVQVLGSGGPRAFGRAGSSYIVLVDGTPRATVDAAGGADPADDANAANAIRPAATSGKDQAAAASTAA